MASGSVRLHQQLHVEVEGLRRTHHLPWQLSVRVTDRQQFPTKMLRMGGTFGPAGGSHRGCWRTRVAHLRGYNVRVGSPFARRCLTLFAHYRTRSYE